MTKSWRVGLISPFSHIAASGLRQVSACLKAAGYETRLVFLPNMAELLNLPQPHPQDYEARVLEQVCELCGDVDLVGLSVMSNHFGRARALTRTIHDRLGKPVIWGGIHPTVKPDECLTWADFVCMGEGEDAMVELTDRLATGQDPTSIPNIWLKDRAGERIANPIRPLNRTLDELPLPDYAVSDHYVLHHDRIVPITPRLLAHYMLDHASNETRVCYMISITRGCPYDCTFCCNNALAQIYPDWRRLRRRSFEHVIAEINAARSLIPDLQTIRFLDDTFLAMSAAELENFCAVYGEQVGLPFHILASPGSVTAARLKSLVAAGLRDVEMGIQTGSHQARQVFHRTENNRQVLQAAQCLRQFGQYIAYPRYDVISDNPYETLADQRETLQLLYDLPRPYRLYAFSLTFYPGTELYERGKADRLIRDDEQDIYRKNYQQLAPTYANLVLWGLHRNLPRWLLKLSLQPVAFKVCDSAIMHWPVRLVWAGVMAIRNWQARRRARQLTANLTASDT
jgi:radical SAM superfamily enzyme YgiQ (UPF0313 family)